MSGEGASSLTLPPSPGALNQFVLGLFQPVSTSSSGQCIARIRVAWFYGCFRRMSQQVERVVLLPLQYGDKVVRVGLAPLKVIEWLIGLRWRPSLVASACGTKAARRAGTNVWQTPWTMAVLVLFWFRSFHRGDVGTPSSFRSTVLYSRTTSRILSCSQLKCDVRVFHQF